MAERMIKMTVEKLFQERFDALPTIEVYKGYEIKDNSFMVDNWNGGEDIKPPRFLTNVVGNHNSIDKIKELIDKELEFQSTSLFEKFFNR